MTKDKNWDEMFPLGRTLFYEGDNPKGFVADMKAKFGFDPSKHSGWKSSRMFHCPAGKLEAIYGSDEYPLGS